MIKINGLKWTVFFVPREHEKLELDEAQCMGITYFSDLQIYIDKSLSKELIKQTVIHELVHAFLFSYGIHIDCIDGKNIEEVLCDFCGSYFDRIYKLADEIVRDQQKQ